MGSRCHVLGLWGLWTYRLNWSYLCHFNYIEFIDHKMHEMKKYICLVSVCLILCDAFNRSLATNDFSKPSLQTRFDEAIWLRFCSNFPSNSAILRLLNCPDLCHVTSWLMCVFWWNFLWLCQVRDIQSIGNEIRTILEYNLDEFYGFVILQRWQVNKKWRFLGLKKKKEFSSLINLLSIINLKTGLI